MLSDNAKKALKNAIADKDLGAEVAAAIDAGGNTAAANVADITSSNLVGVDGTGSNAAPLAGTETRLDALEAKINELLAALQSAGLMS